MNSLQGELNLLCREFLRREDGQDMVEYALFATLLGLGMIVVSTHMTNAIITMFSTLANSL